MWKLSREEKEQIILRSQAKQQQLMKFSAKSWSDLWETDLDNFLHALSIQVIFLLNFYFKFRNKKKKKKPNIGAILIVREFIDQI